ncbi:MAG: hypothetical protein AAF658_12300, partial [Myxococcota bacterium]
MTEKSHVFQWNGVSEAYRWRFLAQEKREWERWSGPFARDPQASTMLRSHPELPLLSHADLLERYAPSLAKSPGTLVCGAAESPGTSRVWVLASAIAGRGGFAARALEPLQFVAEYTGIVRVFAESRALEAA